MNLLARELLSDQAAAGGELGVAASKIAMASKTGRRASVVSERAAIEDADPESLIAA